MKGNKGKYAEVAKLLRYLYLLLEFWKPLRISRTGEARNFKFIMLMILYWLLLL